METTPAWTLTVGSNREEGLTLKETVSGRISHLGLGGAMHLPWPTLFASNPEDVKDYRNLPDDAYFLLVLALKSERSSAKEQRVLAESAKLARVLADELEARGFACAVEDAQRSLLRQRERLQNACYRKAQEEGKRLPKVAAIKPDHAFGPLLVDPGSTGSTNRKWFLYLEAGLRIKLNAVNATHEVKALLQDKQTLCERLAFDILKAMGMEPFAELLDKLKKRAVKSSDGGRHAKTLRSHDDAERSEAIARPAPSNAPDKPLPDRLFDVTSAIQNDLINRFYELSNKCRDGGFCLFEYTVHGQTRLAPFITRPEWVGLRIPLQRVECEFDASVLVPDQDDPALSAFAQAVDASKVTALSIKIDDPLYRLLHIETDTSGPAHSMKLRFGRSMYVDSRYRCIPHLLMDDVPMFVAEALHGNPAMPETEVFNYVLQRLTFRAARRPTLASFGTIDKCVSVGGVLCTTIAPISKTITDRILYTIRVKGRGTANHGTIQPLPRGYHQPFNSNDSPTHVALIDSVAREFMEELLGDEEAEFSAEKASVLERHARLVALMSSGRIRTEVVCFGFSALSGSYEFGVAIYVPNDEDLRQAMPWRSGSPPEDGTWPWAVNWESLGDNKKGEVNLQSAMNFDPRWLTHPTVSPGSRRVHWSDGGVLPSVVETLRALPRLAGREPKLNGLGFAAPKAATFELPPRR